jgi:hypothetical protein
VGETQPARHRATQDQDADQTEGRGKLMALRNIIKCTRHKIRCANRISPADAQSRYAKTVRVRHCSIVRGFQQDGRTPGCAGGCPRIPRFADLIQKRSFERSREKKTASEPTWTMSAVL